MSSLDGKHRAFFKAEIPIKLLTLHTPCVCTKQTSPI